MPVRRNPPARERSKEVVICLINLGAVDVSCKPTYLYEMHWISGLSALRGVLLTPPPDDQSNRFSSSSADLLGMSSCWNNRRIPTGCWPTGIEGTCKNSCQEIGRAHV